MKIYQLLSAAALLTLAACTTNDAVEQQPREPQPLILTASQAGSRDLTGSMTRATDGLYTATTGFSGTESVEVYFNGTHQTYSVGAADADNSYKSTLYGGSLMYPSADTGTENLYAVYPAASATAGSHTVAYDQSNLENGNANYKASDLMFATTSVDLSESKTDAKHLAFSHQLVKLKLVVTKSSTDITAITQIKMQNVKRTVALTPAAAALAQGDLSTAADEQGDEILVFSGSNSSTEAQTYAVVFPAQAWAGTNFLQLTADGHAVNFTLTKSDWENGKEYTLNLDIDETFLDATVAIGNWGNGGEVSIDEPGGGGGSDSAPAGAEAVDLGLSVKWANMNVGATAVGEYGQFFAWGETTGYGSDTSDGRSFDSSSYTFSENPTTLAAANDAATANWGGSWRMPTKAEWEELKNMSNCSWTWKSSSESGYGVAGFLVTSLKSGYTSNSIFLPVAGYRSDSDLNSQGEYGGYWSSSLHEDDSAFAWYFHFQSGDSNVYDSHRRRYFGYSVRAVLAF